MDVDTIEPGADFVQHINDAVGCCNALVVVIGQDWLTATDARGQSRLENREDFVRLEVTAGLERNVRVIPVLVQGARMPDAAELPKEIAPLARRNALELSDTRWRHDVTRLVTALERVLEGEDPVAPAPAGPGAVAAGGRDAPARRRRALLAAAAAAAALAVLAVVLLAGGGDGGGDGERADAPTVQRIPVGRGPSSVTVAGGALWVVNAREGSVTRIDMAGRRVAGNPIRVPAVSDAAGDARGVWLSVINRDALDAPGRLRRIDAGAYRLDPRPIPVGAGPSGVAVDGSTVWVANTGDGTVSAVDAASGRVRRTVRLDALVQFLAVGHGRVWIPRANEDQLATIDTRTMRLRDDPIFVGKEPTGVAVGAGRVWVTNTAENSVSVIDAATRKAVGSPIRVGREPTAVAVGAGAVWVANEADDTLTRIDPRTRRVIGRPLRVGRTPSSLAIAGGAVWVANAGDDSVSRVEP
jgi:serine/threonine-protein kinase